MSKEKEWRLSWRAALGIGVLYILVGLFFLSNGTTTAAVIFVILGVITALVPWGQKWWTARSAVKH
ncbi:hypothetical protein ACFWNH_28940 [Rhodococcus qingshengii]|uniref:hypothetical protein n=1 Tax=Rhodococcus qingshengii TaxID=334542 RepID=UPI0036634243